eukprot:5144099-Karenia_brevis.AAC.2
MLLMMIMTVQHRILRLHYPRAPEVPRWRHRLRRWHLEKSMSGLGQSLSRSGIFTEGTRTTHVHGHHHCQHQHHHCQHQHHHCHHHRPHHHHHHHHVNMPLISTTSQDRPGVQLERILRVHGLVAETSSGEEVLGVKEDGRRFSFVQSLFLLLSTSYPTAIADPLRHDPLPREAHSLRPKPSQVSKRTRMSSPKLDDLVVRVGKFFHEEYKGLQGDAFSEQVYLEFKKAPQVHLLNDLLN